MKIISGEIDPTQNDSLRHSISRRSRSFRSESAYPPKASLNADMIASTLRARIGLMQSSKEPHSLDHLVADGEKLVRHFEAQRLGGLEIDHQLKLRRLLDG
jgi:hypothetical protein